LRAVLAVTGRAWALTTAWILRLLVLGLAVYLRVGTDLFLMAGALGLAGAAAGAARDTSPATRA
jgi:hypothetical protein